MTSPPDEPTSAERLARLWATCAPRVQAYAMRHVDPDTAQKVLSETCLVRAATLADGYHAGWWPGPAMRTPWEFTMTWYLDDGTVGGTLRVPA